ncbi:hypothetical protein [Tenacibaculum aestuariivivum]|uniref:hypothetical protein n=1 Tax=Tenacibaculum aestuariivivum TaxID=2006131 RepID=UPI003AB76FE8
MPLNLLKKYNDLLDVGAYNQYERTASLQAIFNRDIAGNEHFKFNKKRIQPTPLNGVIVMDTLFTHLTTVITDYNTKQRNFDVQRAVRLHWVKHHIDLKKEENILYFSVKEPQGNRTYIYDKDEKYVIVLEPLRKVDEYYLLTAYHLTGKDAKRNKILKKYKRKLTELL